MAKLNDIDSALQDYRSVKNIIVEKYQIWNDVARYNVRAILEKLVSGYDEIILVRYEEDFDLPEDPDKGLIFNNVVFSSDTFHISGRLRYIQMINGNIKVVISRKQEKFTYGFGEDDRSEWVPLNPDINLGEYEPDKIDEEAVYDHVMKLVSTVIEHIS
jgi:hypothetical protein